MEDGHFCQVRPEPGLWQPGTERACLTQGEELATVPILSLPPSPVLHRVRSELHTRWQSNQDLVSSIQQQLAQHSSQLMDLRDALNEAVNKTRQTEDLNSLNSNNLEESQVHLHHCAGHAVRGGCPSPAAP